MYLILYFKTLFFFILKLKIYLKAFDTCTNNYADRSPSPSSPINGPHYNNLTVKQLKELLLNRNIPIGHNLSKQQLLNKLLIMRTPNPKTSRQSYQQNYYKEFTKP